jgi:hypothetical protein
VVAAETPLAGAAAATGPDAAGNAAAAETVEAGAALRAVAVTVALEDGEIVGVTDTSTIDQPPGALVSVTASRGGSTITESDSSSSTLTLTCSTCDDEICS